MIVILLLLLAFLGVSLGSTSSEGSVRAVPQAQVPDVEGLSSPYAEQRVRQAGLTPLRVWCRTRSPVYAVVRQRPAPGTSLPRGAGVRLTLAPALGQGVRHTPCNAVAATRP